MAVVKLLSPAVVNCVVASRAEFSQYFAVATQNFTWPGCTEVAPGITVAVSVTTVPAATDVTSLPALVTVSDMVVGAAVTQACEIVKAAPTAGIASTTSARKLRVESGGAKGTGKR